MIAHSVRNPRAPIYTPNPINRRSSLNRGLVAWWLCVPQWMGGTQWVDLCGMNPGTLTSMANASNGWRNTTRPGGAGAMLFDGTAGLVDVGPMNALFNGANTQITVATWAYTTNLAQSGGVLFSKYNSNAGPTNLYFGLGNKSGQLECDFGSVSGATYLAAFTGNGAALQNAWFRVLATFNAVSQAFAIYVNGISQSLSFQSSGTIPANLFSSTVRAQIGSATIFSGAHSTWQGLQDDTRVWSRVLSASEAADEYNDSCIGYPRTLNRVGHGFARTSGGLLLRRRKAVCGL